VGQGVLRDRPRVGARLRVGNKWHGSDLACTVTALTMLLKDRKYVAVKSGWARCGLPGQPDHDSWNYEQTHREQADFPFHLKDLSLPKRRAGPAARKNASSRVENKAGGDSRAEFLHYYNCMLCNEQPRLEPSQPYWTIAWNAICRAASAIEALGGLAVTLGVIRQPESS